MRPLRLALAGAGLLVLTAGRAEATPLHLTLLPFPDLASSFINVSYTADLVGNTDTFAADGFAMELDDDGIGLPEAILGGNFDILANITETGAIGADGGTLTIGGTIPTLGFLGGTLLTGDLSAFGFQDPPIPPGPQDPFEFLFQVTGGDLAALYGGIGATVGVILYADGGSTFAGTFTANFSNQGLRSGLSNTAPIPEPDGVLLALVGAGLVAWRIRARPRKTANSPS